VENCNIITIFNKANRQPISWYLSEAITLAMQYPERAIKETYYTIAGRHGKSVEAVRKNIRDAIADTWSNSDAKK